MAYSPISDLPSPLAVVCHDAGAANLILPWLGATPPAYVRPVMQGPALGLWRERFGSDQVLMTLRDALDGAMTLLSGSGWGSDLEHQAREIAAAAGIGSIAVLDHWVNYEARFDRAGATRRPDEYWVTDPDALALARLVFPGATIELKPNNYLEEQLAGIGPVPENAQVLYLLEPMRTDWGRGIAGEFQALDYFVQHRTRAGIDAETPIRLRPHPSDEPDKYSAWIARQVGANIALDDSPSLAAAINRANLVAGCQSYAMAIALAAGRQVLSTLPPWAPACVLPQERIVHLRELHSSQ